MPGLTLEQLKAMGAVPKSQYRPQAQKEPSFGEGITSALDIRFGKTQEAFKAQRKGEQTLPETALQVVGQGAGFAFDVLGEAIKSVIDKIPDAIKEPAKAVGKEILDTPIGQAGIRAIAEGTEVYRDWKEGNPRAARNLEAAVNVASLFPVGAGGKAVTQEALGITGKVAGKAATVLEKSALKGIEAEKQSFIRNLIRPVQTKAIKEAQVARTIETGVGPFKKSIIAPSKSELRAEQELMKIPELKKGMTAQQSHNVVQDALSRESESLASKLAKPENKFTFTHKELLSRIERAKQKLSESPLIVGDAEKTADKLIAKVKSLVEERPATGANLLQVRKDFDVWVKSQKPKAFDATSENAFTIANKEIRRAINNFLDEKAPNAGVKESLARQSALFDAIDNIIPKAAIEADTAFRRVLQRVGEVLGTKSRIVQGIVAAVGIGGLGAAATFAPAVAVLGGTGLLLYKGGKLILNPRLRLILSQALRMLERAGDKAGSSAIRDFLKRFSSGEK